MMLHTQTTATDTHEEKQKSGFKNVLRKFKASFMGKDTTTPTQSSKLPYSPVESTYTTSSAPTTTSTPSRPASQPIRHAQATPRTSSQAPRRPASSLTKHSQQSHHHSRPSSIRASLSRTPRYPPPPPEPVLTFTAPTTQTIIHSPLDKRNHRSSISTPALTLRRSYLNSKRDPALVECVGGNQISQKAQSGAGNGTRKSGRSTRVYSQPQPTRSDAASVAASTASKESKVRFSFKVGSVKMMREEGEYEKGGGWTG